MLLLCLCTLSGAFSLTLFRQLPADSVLFTVLVVALICTVRPNFRPVGFILFGFSFMGFAASAQLNDKLAIEMSGQNQVVTVRIDDFPVQEQDDLRFVARPIGRPELPKRIRLAWYDSDVAPKIGETWRLAMRLKRPRGLSNPGGFDFEAWLFRERIGAIGYVADFAHSYRVNGEPRSLVSRIRGRLVSRINNALPKDDSRAVLLAVSAGARHDVSRSQWELFARTGTSHLMAVSGLHIGLVSGLVFLSFWIVLAVVARRQNIRDLAFGMALLAAGSYTVLSGFAVPATRAFLMASAFVVALLLRRRLPFVASFAAVCAIIFITDPMDSLSPGFRLSFGAVAAIAIVATSHHNQFSIQRFRLLSVGLDRGWQLGNLQLALLFGLFPLTVLIFGRVALFAPAVNLIILPVFNFLTAPLTLLGVLLDGPFAFLGNKCLLWAQQSVAVILEILAAVDELPHASQKTRRLEGVLVAAALVPALFVALPAGWPGRRVAILGIIIVLNYKPEPPPPGCMDMHVLDVGQGLAMLLRTDEGSLLYDTGPAYRNGGNTADQVILPFLHGEGIDKIDILVVSHGDQDHAGGVESVLRALPVNRLLVGEPLALPHELALPRQTRCVAGNSWHDQTVSYAVLHPRSLTPWTRNNSSCVLELTIGSQRILLTGDIESPVEKLLLYRKAFNPADTVIVPHHGSRTSSTPELVRLTQPRLAIIAAAFDNRWGFPKADILERWERVADTVANTATSGAVSQRLCAGKPPGEIRFNRVESRRIWHEYP